MQVSEDPNDLSEAAWNWTRHHIPIACADVVLIRDGEHPASQNQAVGLIQRRFQSSGHTRDLWCHIGGRVRLDETLFEAARRHLNETLIVDQEAVIRPKPQASAEFLRISRPGYGYDPSKHAISTVFIAEMPGNVVPDPHGEAISFKWFDSWNIPAPEECWPGTYEIIQGVLQDFSWSNPELTYQAVHASFVTHNELMWQTPVLAMTAMAFLLNFALGNDGDPGPRALAGTLSALTAAASFQLMVKHSNSQIKDADLLVALERSAGMRPVHEKPGKGTTRHDIWNVTQDWLSQCPKPKILYSQSSKSGPRWSAMWSILPATWGWITSFRRILTTTWLWFTHLRSRIVWMFALAVFGLTSLAVAVMAWSQTL